MTAIETLIVIRISIGRNWNDSVCIVTSFRAIKKEKVLENSKKFETLRNVDHARRSRIEDTLAKKLRVLVSSRTHRGNISFQRVTRNCESSFGKGWKRFDFGRAIFPPVSSKIVVFRSGPRGKQARFDNTGRLLICRERFRGRACVELGPPCVKLRQPLAIEQQTQPRKF